MSAAALAVVLAGVAGALAADRGGDVTRRLARLGGRGGPGGPGRPGRPAPTRARSTAAPGQPPAAGVTRVVGTVAGLALVTGHGGVAVVLGVLAVATGVPAGRLRRAAAAEQAAVARDLPRAADLLASCLEAGAAPAAALAVVAQAMGGPVGSRLAGVAAGLASGSDVRDVVDPAGRHSPGVGGADPVARLVRALARATVSGAPLARVVREVAADERERDRWAGLERARRAGVQAVGPLAACFLPAFVLVGVVPVVVGVAGSVLSGVR